MISSRFSQGITYNSSSFSSKPISKNTTFQPSEPPACNKKMMLAPKLLISLITIFFCANVQSSAPQTNDTGCGLDFSLYPYEPVGECIKHDKEEVIIWDYVQTTKCCQYALSSISKALALWSYGNKDIFLPKAQWQSCTSLIQTQESQCGYDTMYRKDDKCSSLTLTSFQIDYRERYVSALQSCSQFDRPSFDYQCSTCTRSISDMMNYLLSELQVKSEDEKAMCSIATIVAIAWNGIRNASWVGDFYRCLPALDIEDHGYLKIKRRVAKSIFVAFIAIIGLVLLIILIKFVIKKSDKKSIEGKMMNTWAGLYIFSKAEIEKAINYGSNKVCLGSGSAGRVYQGVLPSGQLVAIKHIYKSAMSGSFTREVEGLSRIRHPNLVTLFGYCVAEDEQYLVYEYCPNGNLAQNLLRSDSILPWDRRVKILRDCALALRFLHTHPDGCIVHRDIKLTNILLTENMEPKLSDFGLAKLIGMEESRVFTDVRGTIGYMDPEYMSNAKLSCSSDIYSFGIVALQFLSGRKVIELDIEARDTLTKKAKDVAMGKRPLQDFVDPRLKGDLNLRDFESLLHVAVLCVANSSKGRPTIHDVLEELNKAWDNTVSYMSALARRETYTLSGSGSQPSQVIEC